MNKAYNADLITTAILDKELTQSYFTTTLQPKTQALIKSCTTVNQLKNSAKGSVCSLYKALYSHICTHYITAPPLSSSWCSDAVLSPSLCPCALVTDLHSRTYSERGNNRVKGEVSEAFGRKHGKRFTVFKIRNMNTIRLHFMDS